jgi:polyhydroxybutyrate depolymerase
MSVQNENLNGNFFIIAAYKFNSKMIRIQLFVVAFFTAIISISAQYSNKSMMVGATSRTYRQYLPTGFNAVSEPGVPLLIALHGLGDNMTNFSTVGFGAVADTARFIVVYPQGMLNGFGNSAWNNGTLLSSTADDITFLSMLIDTMKVKYDIDLRVYLTGFSMGGIMTYHTVCALPSRIAAIASVSGTMATSDISGCNPNRAVPVMHMHGTADGTVPYNSGALPSLSLVPQTLEFWQNNNGCGDSSIYAMPDISPDGITVDTMVFNTCNAPLVHWRENNADHEWLYTPVNDVDATKEIWLFFSDKVHPGASQLGVTEIPEYHTTIEYKNAMLSIVSSIPIQEIGIYDLQGKLIRLMNVTDLMELNIDLTAYSTQIFIVKVLSEGMITTRKILVIK